MQRLWHSCREAGVSAWLLAKDVVDLLILEERLNTVSETRSREELG